MMKHKLTVINVVMLSCFIFIGASCELFSSGPSEAEIVLQNRISQIELDLAASEEHNDDLTWQLLKAEEDLKKLTDPEQIAQGERIIADMKAQLEASAEKIKIDQAQRDLLEAVRKAAEADRLALEAASADTNTTISAILSVIPPPWGTIGTAVFAVVAGFAEAKRRKANTQRDASIRAIDRSKTNVVRDKNSDKVIEFTVDATKLAEVQESTPGLSAAIREARV